MNTKDWIFHIPHTSQRCDRKLTSPLLGGIQSSTRFFAKSNDGPRIEQGENLGTSFGQVS